MSGDKYIGGIPCKLLLFCSPCSGDFAFTIYYCKNRLVVLTAEWLPWLHGLLWYYRSIV